MKNKSWCYFYYDESEEKKWAAWPSSAYFKIKLRLIYFHCLHTEGCLDNFVKCIRSNINKDWVNINLLAPFIQNIQGGSCSSSRVSLDIWSILIFDKKNDRVSDGVIGRSTSNLNLIHSTTVYCCRIAIWFDQFTFLISLSVSSSSILIAFSGLRQALFSVHFGIATWFRIWNVKWLWSPLLWGSSTLLAVHQI